MTIQSRTIRVPMDPLTAGASNVTATSTTKTIPIPMTTSRVFRDVRLEVSYHSGVNVLTTTAMAIGVKLGAAAVDTQTVTKSITNTGEDYTVIQIRDVTSYFAANFGAGTSQTFSYDFNATYAVGDFSLLSAVLVITFDWDDASGAGTRVKSVPLVLDNSLLLTPSLQQIGSGNLQIPILNTVLGESSKTFQHIWFEIDSNYCSTSSAVASLQVALDAESPVVIDAGSSQNSSSHMRYRWVRNDMVTTSTHTFSILSTTANRHSHARIVMWVTYTYDHTASTRITNHVRVPWAIEGVVSGDPSKPSRARATVSIQEPGTITILNAGVSANYHSAPSPTRRLNWRIGSQSFRLFNETTVSLMTGPMFLGKRFDSLAEDGAGVSFSTGENTVNIDVYQEAQADTDNITIAGWCSGWVDVTYTSDKATGGDGLHNTVYERTLIDRNQSSNSIFRAISNAVAAVPFSSDYYRQGTGFEFHCIQSSPAPSIQIIGERKSTGGEGGPSWERVGGSAAYVFTASGELINGIFVGAAEFGLKRFTADVSRPMVAHDTRSYMLMTTTGALNLHLTMTSTFHRIKTTRTGTLLDYPTGDGSGFTVLIFKNNELFTSVTTAIGGTFSFDTWDNANTYFALCISGANAGASILA